jgi:hypothetical protein
MQLPSGTGVGVGVGMNWPLQTPRRSARRSRAEVGFIVVIGTMLDVYFCKFIGLFV